MANTAGRREEVDRGGSTARDLLVVLAALVVVFGATWSLADAAGLDELGGGAVEARVLASSPGGGGSVVDVVAGDRFFEDVNAPRVLAAGEVVTAWQYRDELRWSPDLVGVALFASVATLVAALCAVGIWTQRA